jgi:hypothetical protein
LNRLTSKQLEGGNKLSRWVRRKSFDENNNQTVIHSKVESHSLEKLCQEFARILGGEGMLTDENVCLVQKFRDIDFTIEGVPTRSPLVNPQFFTFEIRGGEVLNLGETVLLQEEVNPLLTELRDRNITVTAVHNHWLFDDPRAMYMHFQSTDDNPLEFARDVREAFKVLKE